MGKEDRKQKKGLEYSGAEAELLEQRKAMLVSLMNEEAYVPMKLKELAILLNVPKEQREELKQVLNLLLAEGKISVSKKGKFGKAEAFALVGVFSGNARGFGFVAIEGQEEDVFIPADRTGGALHGDRVQIVIDSEGRGGRPEGTVVRILEHANETLVGTYEKGKGYGFVIPDNQRISKDIFIPQGCSQGAVSGHKVMVKIRDFGEKKGKKPEGVITEILGHIHDPGVDILSIVRAYNLPEDFPGAVKNQLKQVPDEVKKDSWAGRKDLRDLPTVTIDGEEAKDLDDAISIERAGDGYRLGVHIADVSHYVQEHTPLDEEAFKRGTSVYLVDRVIPMLPHKLSNGICSLNEGEDRLALSCLMEIDSQGNVTGHEIAETVIRSDRRMTYTAVNAIVTDHDFARGARCARSGEHTGLGDGTYIIGDAPLEQLIGFIKNAGFGISVEIQIDGFTWVHRKGGYILPIAAHQHAIRLGIDGDLSRYGCGCGMIQRNEIFPCRIWRSEYIAADGLVAGRGDSEAGTIGRDGVIMLVEGVGA